MPEVSIIIPVYNTGRYLENCVVSAVNQSFTDTEIILVDDGSTDGSGLLCDELAQRDERITVIHKVNGGLSDARNAGLDAAKGKFIYFFDSDDTIETNLLETALSNIGDADIISFSYKRVYEDSRYPKVFHTAESEITIETPEQKLDFLLNFVLKYKMGWEAWGRLYRRDIIEKYHLRFADNKKIFAEDMYFCAAYCAHIRKSVSIDTVLYNYMIRDNSIMANNKFRLNFGRMLELSKALLEHYKKYDDCTILRNHYYLFTYMILNNALDSAKRTNKSITVSELREMIVNDNIDTDFFRQQVNELKKNKKDFLKIYPLKEADRRLTEMIYYADGNVLFRKVRNAINKFR